MPYSQHYTTPPADRIASDFEDMHRRKDILAMRAASRRMLVILAIVGATLLVGVWIGRGITQFNHDRLEAAQ